MADAIARISLPDQVFHRLVADVLAGRHAPGDRLPTQRRLAAELGVNMASVREGVKRLEQLRPVEVRHGDALRARDRRVPGRALGLPPPFPPAGRAPGATVRRGVETP